MNSKYSLKELQKRLGYTFHNEDLLRQAITHSSFANEQKINNWGDYERIEFLGDAVLEMVSSSYLYHENPQMPEGKLTKTRASLVCEQSLAFCARKIELGQFLYLGKGEELSGGRNRDSIIADVVEACIGAIFLDSGIEEAQAFIHRFILTDVDEIQLFLDSKSILQEMVQANEKQDVSYVLKSEEGPDHDKQFVVVVMVGDQIMGEGVGHTKKAAEQQAAYQAVLKRQGK